jgi:hypothetical protein
MEDDEIEIKHARMTTECFKMLDEAVAYIVAGYRNYICKWA